ncbi:hypothetical protein LCGC14_2147870 [marine sediment metagenome]|uniref:Uncharacterized protein n=1 Tax=marine sediment metagenome TaxID=412755 RepID=A0A0F9DWA6_9ZZZZ
MKTKVCRKCKVEKPAEEFYAKKERKDGLQYSCKICQKNYLRTWLHNNRDYMLGYRRKYNKANRKKLNEQIENWRLKHPERSKAKNTLKVAVINGKIKKPTICSVCLESQESKQLHGHHDDYSKPLDVEWLCSPCHGAKHITLRGG